MGKLKSQFIERLNHQGYEAQENVKIEGKSGAEHCFDLLARRDDGFLTYTLAIGIIIKEDQKIGLDEVFSFDEKCYDCGIRDKILIALPGLEPIASRFAQNQRIKVLEEENLKELLSSPPPVEQNKKIFFSPKTKSEMIRNLSQLDYKVEENAKLKGRSGAEYNFDIFASLGNGFVTHRVGIDDLSGEEVNLSRLSLFDTKAFDTGIYNKVLLISEKPSFEAEQFAQHQRIKFIWLDTRAQGSTEEKISGLQETVEEVLTETPGKKPPKRLSQRISPEVLNLIPESTARRFNVMPIAIVGDFLRVAMVNPSDIFTLEALSLQTRMRVEPVAAAEEEIWEAIDLHYKGLGKIEEQVSHIPEVKEVDAQALSQAAEDTPVASALRLTIEEAVKARVSDIHFSPQEDKLKVRYRIDGALQDVMSLPLKMHLPLTSRVKIMANMDIADRLRPQDGQFSIKAKGRQTDVRVATSPTIYGEMTTLRLLNKSSGFIDLPQLGFSSEALAKYERMLKVPFGMVINSGPTGAGKTTTLYASINKLDKISRNIITIEDPVEYRFKNINQIQVNPKAGLDFASGLRSILRLDPDVIMVGEIRDAETARIAVQSALTGHLVLSSIHANDAVGIISRLLDLGIEPFLVSSAVIGVVAQRMVRRVCPNCSSPKKAHLEEQEAYVKETGESKTEFLYGEGCELCNYTGYRGRIGIFELLLLNENIKMQILNHASATEIREQAIKEGMVPLLKDGMLKVKEGITTPEEVLRNAYFIE